MIKRMKRKKPFSYEEFKQIYSQVPRICIDLVIENPNQEILLLERINEPYQGFWHLPGGTLLFRERVEDCIKRIASEETGLKVTVKGLVGFIEFLEEERDNKPFHSVSMAVYCTASDIKPVSSDGEVLKFFKDIPEKTIPEQKEFLAGFLTDECHNPDCEEDHEHS
jgi:ADP-ribose pyrophosphatase YjhB (NUDIX family)